MAEDTRTFKKYTVCGSAEIRDDRTEEFVRPGGVVELSSEDKVIEQRARGGGVHRIVLAATDVVSLLDSGFIAEVADAPAKAEKKV